MCGLVEFGGLFRPNTGSQSVFAIVCLFDGLGGGAECQHTQYRTKDFLPNNSVGLLNVQQQCGLDKQPVIRKVAGGALPKLGAFFPAEFNVSLNGFVLLFGVDGTASSSSIVIFEAPEITVTSSAAMVTEGNSVMLTVAADPAPLAPVQVAFTITGTGITEEDYTLT